MTMEKLVSAIITTHNRKKLLERAIESVFAQTYKNIELIVVDDHSTDGTCDICQDSRIKYIYIPKEESRGGNYARNLGIKNSRGEYCAFLDDDDFWKPEKIEKQLKLIREKKCSMVFCLREKEYVKNGKVIKIGHEYPYKPSGDISQEIFKHYITNTSCILAEKEKLYQIGLFDENLRKWQEYDLMIRMSERTNIYYVEEYLCVYRNDYTDKNRVSNDFDRVIETTGKIREKYRDRLAALPIKTKLYFCDTCIGDIYSLACQANKRKYKYLLFVPYYILMVFKFFDDRNFATRYMQILQRKLHLKRS